MAKNIYRGREFKFYDELMSFQQALLDDFNQLHPKFTGLYQPTGLPPHTPDALNVNLLKYQLSGPVTPLTCLEQTTNPENYPATFKEINRLFPECNLVAYSLLSPHSIIRRHHDHENKYGNTIKIHIPLIVPEGDLGLEVEGETVDWSDLFAFSHQLLHSVWNNTDYHRLVFMLDLPRELCGLPPGEPININKKVEPFPKTWIENLQIAS